MIVFFLVGRRLLLYSIFFGKGIFFVRRIFFFKPVLSFFLIFFLLPYTHIKYKNKLQVSFCFYLCGKKKCCLCCRAEQPTIEFGCLFICFSFMIIYKVCYDLLVTVGQQNGEIEDLQPGFLNGFSNNKVSNL